MKIEIRKILGVIKRSLTRSSSPNHKHALNYIDDKLEKYLDFRNGFFVEAGAYDGVDQSNTYYLEKEKGWNGILIEPIFENARRLFYLLKKENSRLMQEIMLLRISLSELQKTMRINFLYLS